MIFEEYFYPDRCFVKQTLNNWWEGGNTPLKLAAVLSLWPANQNRISIEQPAWMCLVQVVTIGVIQVRFLGDNICAAGGFRNC